MATGAPFTLIDLARRTDPTGDAADVAELLSQANEIYDDLVWKEGNTNTGHVYTVRGFMDIQAIRDKNVLISPKDFAGFPTENYRGVPIRIMDQIKNSETRVV